MEINVLIVDDEAYCVEKLIHDLDWPSLGIHRAYSAYSATQAMKVMESESIQLLICDIEMPGASGLELIEWINEASRLMNFSIECLMLTCHPEYEFMRKAMQLGCSDYLLKPFKTDEMCQAIRTQVKKIHENSKKNPDFYKPYVKIEKSVSAVAAEMENDFPPDTALHIQSKVIPYIQEHIAAPITVTEIAQTVNLNPQYLMRLFRKQMGCSIIQYVTRYKMALARDMLIHTAASNADIAEKLGYLNTTYFLRVFKENEGITPGAFRKKHSIYNSN